MNKKLGFFLRSLVHFTYHESTINELLKKGYQVQLYFDPIWGKKNNISPDYVNQWIEKNNQAPFKWFVIRSSKNRNFIFAWREFVTFLSYCHRQGQSEFYTDRWYKYLAPKLRKKFTNKRKIGRFLRQVFSSSLVYNFLKHFEMFFSPDKKIKEFLQNEKLDMVIVSPGDLRFSEEIEVVKAAKKLKLKVIIPVYSWDNLTTKGLIHEKPDLLLAWNKEHMQEATSVHNIPARSIKITGSPFFDKWFSIEKNIKKYDQDFEENFYTETGLDKNTPFILYLGSSGNIAKDETWLIQDLFKKLKEHPEFSNFKILIRPHPSNFKHYEKILNQDILMYPKPPFNFELGVPETREDVYYFYKSMKESSFVLGVNTSAMIEAVINNSPVISFMHPKYKKTQEQAVHFKHLIQSESIYIVDNEKDFIIKARSIVQNEALERIEKRKEFVQSFIRPLGLKDSAGYIQAHAIHEEIQKQG